MALAYLLEPVLDRVHTVSKDNGRNFADHEAVTTALNTAIYFVHPYSSWERGLDENTNGMIRQYFPCHRDCTMITEAEVNFVMERLNNRPTYQAQSFRRRKCHELWNLNQIFFKRNVPIFSAETQPVAFLPNRQTLTT